MRRRSPEADHEVAQPVVRVHPESGRRALYVNAIYTTRFENMSEPESRPLLDFLYEHCTGRNSPAASLGDRLARDLGHRCTMHYAVNDYDGSRRLMHRTTVAGERPIGAGRA